MVETEVDFREDHRLHRLFSSLQSLPDVCAALNPHQNLVSGEDGHALYGLMDGDFVPFCNRRCGVLYSFFCLLHAGANAVCVGAALQDHFLLLLSAVCSARISANCALQASLPSPPSCRSRPCYRFCNVNCRLRRIDRAGQILSGRGVQAGHTCDARDFPSGEHQTKAEQCVFAE